MNLRERFLEPALDWVRDHRVISLGIGAVLVLAVVAAIVFTLVLGHDASSIGLGGLKLGSRVLVLYTVDDFTNWALADSTLPMFKAANQCEVRVEKFAGGGPLMERLIAEKKNPVADVVFGLDATYLSDVIRNNLLATYRPPSLSRVGDRFKFDRSGRMIPVTYSYLAFMYDSETVPQPPEYFGALQAEAWKNKLILPDPRTTGQGRAMLLWTQALYSGEGFPYFWKAMNGTINSFNPNLDAAYGVFLAGTAPMVLNYATRSAYHSRTQNTERYKYFIPREGGYRYVETVGIVQGSRRATLARKFVDYTLSESFQQVIPTTLWMFPVVDGIPVPAPFDNIAAPTRDFSPTTNAATCGNLVNELLRIWKRSM